MTRRSAIDLTSAYNRTHRTVNDLMELDLVSEQMQNAIQGALDALEHLDQVAQRAGLVRDIARAEGRLTELKRQLQFYETGVIPPLEDEVDPA
jgi:bacterioferritin (cytochrome b1)